MWQRSTIQEMLLQFKLTEKELVKKKYLLKIKT